MMTVNEVSRLTGVSIRALQYYDKIGLLRPTGHTRSGYRLYDDAALETLQQILLFRELKFPLKTIKEILSGPDFDREKALEQQISLLTMRKEHLERLIEFAREIQLTGGGKMDFSVFDTKKMDDYARQAKERWGATPAYKEYEEKSQEWAEREERELWKDFMQIFVRFGELKGGDPASAEAQEQVGMLQGYITEHFYECTDAILADLGRMYAAGGEFTANINRCGGAGTAEFAAEAVRIYCKDIC